MGKNPTVIAADLRLETTPDGKVHVRKDGQTLTLSNAAEVRLLAARLVERLGA